jgi:hypothetical protein
LLVFGAIGVTLAAVLIANNGSGSHASSPAQGVTLTTATST